ncbi:hypothetical protein [Gimesia aquarii]|uniref:Uncharacterized protein n=1 Tax=Gimesia aquarii TaxID=2527964 RepID=A0A517W2R0_9PLAN|nr:hypothetical protein [Gimesia aquarii]QDT99543.1 hypothetical protein V144x_50550 [Gimesia aquarii]
MNNSSKFDRIRRSALDSVEQSERHFRKAIVGFAFIEGTCWIGYITLAAFSFSLPVLIGVAAVAVYVMVTGALMGLKLHMDACTQRTLTAIELLAEDEPDDNNSDTGLSDKKT